MPKMIKLKSGVELFYASEKPTSDELKDYSNFDLDRFDSSSDLEAGVYEGGLKVWECALDLCNFLDIYQGNGISLENLDVLELGCGAGLPSLVALKKGANSVTLQDFNDFVIELFTKRNLALNGVPLGRCQSIASEWGVPLLEKLGSRKFQLILTSETIYNESNYKPLVETMDALLSDGGKIYLAAKSYYFGVGGSIASFQEYLIKQGVFEWEEVWSTKKSSVPRKIMELKRRKR